jgi:hypothetical protein
MRILCAAWLMLNAGGPHEPTYQGTSVIPLIVEGVEILPADRENRSPRQIAVQVRNVGTCTIVAWGLRGRVTFANGVSSAVGTGIDGYESAVRAVPDDPVLQVGAVYTIRMEIPSRDVAEPVSATAVPIHAVFDDDTAVGDDRSVDFVFRQRALNARVWQLISQALDNAADGSTDAIAALRMAQAALEAAEEADRQSLPCREVQNRIRFALTGLHAAEIQQLFGELRKEARVRSEVAAAHAVRR